MEKEVERIQNYLEARGVIASETAIINAAFNIVQHNGPGLYAFYCELKDEQEKKEKYQKEKRK